MADPSVITNYRAVLFNLYRAIQLYTGLNPEAVKMTPAELTQQLMEELAASTAALAQPEPQGPTDEELWELYEQGCGEPGDWAWVRDYARAALTRWGRPTPQPILVSKRLPGPEDCDADGRCWHYCVAGDGVGDWIKRKPTSKTLCEHYRLTHWLPASDIPSPDAQPML